MSSQIKDFAYFCIWKYVFLFSCKTGACAMDSSVVIFGGFDGRQAANTFATISADFGFGDDAY